MEQHGRVEDGFVRLSQTMAFRYHEIHIFRATKDANVQAHPLWLPLTIQYIISIQQTELFRSSQLASMLHKTLVLEIVTNQALTATKTNVGLKNVQGTKINKHIRTYANA